MADDRDDSITTHAGASDFVTFEVVGAPAPEFRIEPVGDDPDIRYRYQYDDRGYPTPEQFERVGHLEVRAAVLSADLDDDLAEDAVAVLEAIQSLRSAMADARELDDEQRQDIALGNLDALPEVEYIRGDE